MLEFNVLSTYDKFRNDRMTFGVDLGSFAMGTWSALLALPNRTTANKTEKWSNTKTKADI